MLERIHVRNFALIEDLALSFHPKLNIFTGETGAGKTILIDALSAVLGERLDLVSLRLKDQNCIIEAVFDLRRNVLRKREEIAAWFSEEDESLVLYREVTPDGRNKCSINGRAANVSNLREVGRHLADFHGQHDHQLLLDPASHLLTLDRLAGAEGARQLYLKIFLEYAELKRQREELLGLRSGRERELDLLKYQIDEIEKIRPEAGEDLKLKEEFIRMSNVERLSGRASELLDRLLEGDGSAMDQLGHTSKLLGELTRIDESLKPLQGQLTEAEHAVSEVATSMRDYLDGLSFDSHRFKEVEERMDALEVLKRKYGGSIDKALNFLDSAKTRHELLAHSEERTGELEEKIKEREVKVLAEARKLTAERKRAAEKLKMVIERELKELGIRHAHFECRIEKIDPAETGCDRVEFYISPNAGEELLPLARIISGGEASRVMLALKRALIDTDEIPTMIFDEIDANIGGRLGSVVGEKLSEIAAKHQVLLVTHLPQIASFADQHVKVTKAVENKRTKTKYAVIEGEARVRELTEMMEGEKQSEIAAKHAREMLTAKDAPRMRGVSGAVPARGFRPRAGGGDAERRRPLTDVGVRS